MNMVEKWASSLHLFETEYAKIIFILLFMGMLWGLTRIAFGLYIIYQLKKNAIIEELNSQKIWFHSSIEIPFTFFNLLFLPPSFKQNNNIPMILAHENAHIKLNHSYGKIYYSILQAIFWFNPFVYFYHHALDLQHELEADEFAIRNLDKTIYLNNYLMQANAILAPTLMVHGHFKHDQKIRISRLTSQTPLVFIEKLFMIILVLIIIFLGILFQI